MNACHSIYANLSLIIQTIIAEASRMFHPMKMPIVRLIRTNLLIRWTMVQYIWIRIDAHDADTDNS